MQASTFQLVLGAGWFVKLVLVVLMGFSIGSWAVVFYKLWVLHLADQQSRAFLNAFQSGGETNDLLARARTLLESPPARVFQAVHAGQGRARRESLDSLLTRLVTQETNALYSYLGFLATTGATTTASEAEPTAPMPRKASMMPHTVPSSPMNGVVDPVVARNPR